MFSSVRLQPQCPLPIDVSDRGPPTTWSPHAHRRINGQRHDHVMKHDHFEGCEVPFPTTVNYGAEDGCTNAQRQNLFQWQWRNAPRSPETRTCPLTKMCCVELDVRGYTDHCLFAQTRREEWTGERDPDFRWSQAQRRWHTQQRNVRETINRCSGLQIQTSVLVNVIFSCDVVPQIN